jgi:hypothetical protein
MRILVVGAGGVGAAIAAIAARREYFDRMVLADVDVARAEAAVQGLAGSERFGAAAVDASDPASVAALAREVGADVVLNACDPRLNPPIFDGAFAAGCTYVDMAMHLSKPHPERPHEEVGVKLGDAQFAAAEQWEAAGRLEAALQDDERRALLHPLLGRVGDPDPLALVEPAAGHEPVEVRELDQPLARRPDQDVEERRPGLGVRFVEGPHEPLGLADVETLLEVDRGLVPSPHDVRHDAPQIGDVADQITVGTSPPDHGARLLRPWFGAPHAWR